MLVVFSFPLEHRHPADPSQATDLSSAAQRPHRSADLREQPLGRLGRPRGRARDLLRIDAAALGGDDDAFGHERQASVEATRRVADLRLVSGMPLDAFVGTGQRSPLAYLFAPLIEQIEFAWREDVQ